MATTKQVKAARQNIRKAGAAARKKRTIANLPKATRQDLGRQAAKARSRGGRAGHAYEDRTRTSCTRWPSRRASAVGRRWASGT
jgi:hypothetical protein